MFKQNADQAPTYGRVDTVAGTCTLAPCAYQVRPHPLVIIVGTAKVARSDETIETTSGSVYTPMIIWKNVKGAADSLFFDEKYLEYLAGDVTQQ